MDEEEPFVRRRDVGGQEEIEILDEDEQQKVIDEIEKDYRQLTATQTRFIVLGSSIVFLVLSCISFFSGDYVFFFLPGLATGVLALMVIFRPTWAVSASLSIEVISILGMIQNWPNRPLLLIFIVHLAYAVMLLGHILSQQFARSVPEKIKHLESLKYHVKMA
jgi:hypothetical protein